MGYCVYSIFTFMSSRRDTRVPPAASSSSSASSTSSHYDGREHEVTLNGIVYKYIDRAPKEIHRAIPHQSEELQDAEDGTLEGYEEAELEDWEMDQFERMIDEQRRFIVGGVAPHMNIDRRAQIDASMDSMASDRVSDLDEPSIDGSNRDFFEPRNRACDSDGWMTSDDGDDEDSQSIESDGAIEVSENEFSYMDRCVGGPMMSNFHHFTAHSILSHQGHDFLLIKSIWLTIEPVIQLPVDQRPILNFDMFHNLLLVSGAVLERVLPVGTVRSLVISTQYKMNDNTTTEQDELDKECGNHQHATSKQDLRGIISDFCVLVLKLSCCDKKGKPILVETGKRPEINELALITDPRVRQTYNVRIMDANFVWRTTPTSDV